MKTKESKTKYETSMPQLKIEYIAFQFNTRYGNATNITRTTYSKFT